jgi:hypothetical protein
LHLFYVYQIGLLAQEDQSQNFSAPCPHSPLLSIKLYACLIWFS